METAAVGSGDAAAVAASEVASVAVPGTVAVADRNVAVAVDAAAAGPDAQQATGHMMQLLKLRDHIGTVLPVTHLWKAYHSSQNLLVEQLTQPMRFPTERR